MPVVKVSCTPLTKEQKSALGQAFFDDLKAAVSAPVVDVFFEEYDTVYVSGREKTEKAAAFCVEGPVVDADKLADVGARMYKSFSGIVGEGWKIMATYHANDKDHIAFNGTLLSRIPAKG